MRIDLPCCGFHYCKYQFDGNCTDREKYQKCEYQYYANLADAPDSNVGKWKQITPAKIYECDQCGQQVMTQDIECYKFCHGCGVRMEGDTE